MQVPTSLWARSVIPTESWGAREGCSEPGLRFLGPLILWETFPPLLQEANEVKSTPADFPPWVPQASWACMQSSRVPP